MSYLCASPCVYVVIFFFILVMFVIKCTRCPHAQCLFLFFLFSSTSILEKSDMSPDTGKFEVFRVKHSCASSLNICVHKAGV